MTPSLGEGTSADKRMHSEKLMHAGYHEKAALSVFYAFKVLSTLIGFVCAFTVFYLDIGDSYNNLLIWGRIFSLSGNILT
ncbi:hypothetical protein O9992_05310 [Vibrio lentus]|nr:hypothetical protein [Vibrio lentus]